MYSDICVCLQHEFDVIWIGFLLSKGFSNQGVGLVVKAWHFEGFANLSVRNLLGAIDSFGPVHREHLLRLQVGSGGESQLQG